MFTRGSISHNIPYLGAEKCPTSKNKPLALCLYMEEWDNAAGGVMWPGLFICQTMAPGFLCNFASHRRWVCVKHWKGISDPVSF